MKEFEKIVAGSRVLILGSAPNAVIPPKSAYDVLVAVNASIAAFPHLVPDILLLNGWSLKNNNEVRISSLVGLAGRSAKHLVCIENAMPQFDMLKILYENRFDFLSNESITKEERQYICNEYTGLNPEKSGGENAASTGVTAAIMAHKYGAKEIILSGISLSGGHSYIEGEMPRGHLYIDGLILGRIGFKSISLQEN